MSNSDASVALGDVALVQADGPDARTFLDGQFSNSLASLERGESRFGAFCNPKGRVIALARIAVYRDGLLLALDQGVADVCVTTLRRYVLRARVTLDRAESLHATGVIGRAADSARDAVCSWPLGGTGGESLALTAVNAAAVSADPAGRAAWDLAMVRAGLPSLCAATTGQFVPQMLNLDLLDGISFSKGCYTGQEIVARTQNLGTIKRRMLRFAAAGDEPVTAGQAVVNAGAEVVGRVVRAAAGPAGQEVLAVIRLSEMGDRLYLERPDGMELSPLPLPYAIPEYGA